MFAGFVMQIIAYVSIAIWLGVTPDWNYFYSNSTALVTTMTFLAGIGWSIGIGLLQFIIAVEVFPTRIRAMGFGISMVLRWWLGFAMKWTIIPQLNATSPWGIHVFWVFVNLFGLIVLFFWLPETKRVPLERMSELFEGRWWQGRKAKLSVLEAPLHFVHSPTSPTTAEGETTFKNIATASEAPIPETR